MYVLVRIGLIGQQATPCTDSPFVAASSRAQDTSASWICAQNRMATAIEVHATYANVAVLNYTAPVSSVQIVNAALNFLDDN